MPEYVTKTARCYDKEVYGCERYNAFAMVSFVSDKGEFIDCFIEDRFHLEQLQKDIEKVLDND